MTDVPADEVHEIAESSASSASSTTRRQFMLGACASAAARAFAAAAGFGAPFGLSPAFAYAPPAGGGLDAFLALSQQLTGRTSFDATLGQRVYDALTKDGHQLDYTRQQSLDTYISTAARRVTDTISAALASDAVERLEYVTGSVKLDVSG